MPIPGLCVVTFNVPPVTYRLIAGWAAQTGNKLVLVMNRPGAILDHHSTNIVIPVRDGAGRHHAAGGVEFSCH